jgi:hypothetical protein
MKVPFRKNQERVRPILWWRSVLVNRGGRANCASLWCEPQETVACGCRTLYSDFVVIAFALANHAEEIQ